MNYKIMAIITASLLVILSSFISISSKTAFYADLLEGKNTLRINLSEPIYVETLIKLNPDIEAISYIEGNKTIGYVNVFFGLGKNFVLEDRDYEIIANKNITLVLPS